MLKPTSKTDVNTDGKDGKDVANNDAKATVPLMLSYICIYIYINNIEWKDNTFVIISAGRLEIYR